MLAGMPLITRGVGSGADSEYCSSSRTESIGKDMSLSRFNSKMAKRGTYDESTKGDLIEQQHPKKTEAWAVLALC